MYRIIAESWAVTGTGYFMYEMKPRASIKFTNRAELQVITPMNHLSQLLETAGCIAKTGFHNSKPIAPNPFRFHELYATEPVALQVTVLLSGMCKGPNGASLCLQTPATTPIGLINTMQDD
jgi:hypothetical protein